MKSFFSKSIFEDNNIHIKHIFYPLLMMGMGYKSMVDYDWLLFGITFFILGVILFFVVCLGIAWRGPIEYWEQIERVVKVLSKINSPEVWHALGFKEVPKSTIDLMERKVDHNGNFTGFEYKQLSVNAVMLNTIANKVLLSGKIDFTEDRFKNITPNFRKTKEEFKKQGYITQSTNHPKSSYVFTKKGMDKVIYMYADKAIKLQVQKESNNATERIEE